MLKGAVSGLLQPRQDRKQRGFLIAAVAHQLTAVPNYSAGHR
jgi:hypothetical protein